jgi:hypothetical protein
MRARLDRAPRISRRGNFSSPDMAPHQPARALVPRQFLRHGVCMFDPDDHPRPCHHRRYRQRYGAGASDQRLHHRWARDALRHHERPGWSGCRSLRGDEAQDWRSRRRSRCPWPHSQVKLHPGSRLRLCEADIPERALREEPHTAHRTTIIIPKRSLTGTLR